MIRSLESNDFESWEKLWQAYLHFYRNHVSDEVTKATFERLSSAGDDLVGLVALDDDGDLVGIAHIVFHSSTWSTDPYCYLEDLFVAPSARGSGVSERLIEGVYEQADRRRATRTYWETQEFNGPARSLYDQVAHRTSAVIYER